MKESNQPEDEATLKNDELLANPWHYLFNGAGVFRKHTEEFSCGGQQIRGSWLLFVAEKKRKLKQKVQERKTEDEATLNSTCFFYGFMFLTSFPNSIMEDAHIGSEETFHARAPFYCDPLFLSRFRDGERDKKRKIS